MEENKFSARIVSSLEKALVNKLPGDYPVHTHQSVLLSEKIDFQLFFRDSDTSIPASRFLEVSVEGAPFEFSVRSVENVCVDMPTFNNDNSKGTPLYLESETGCYPDILLPIDSGKYIRPAIGKTLSLWFTAQACVAGEFDICVRIKGATLLHEESIHISVVDSALPEQKLIFTEWFHCDCLSSYYNVPMFSDRHFEIIKNYMKNAVSNGINCILTPVLTPPLDTKVGTYRPTAQLVGVVCTEDGYSFDYSLLDRWVEQALECGVKYFEISHLFSQWGAEFAPQVVAERDGERVRIFGWDTPGTGEAYREFIAAFISALVAHLKELGVLDRCLFHISDEPREKNLEGYLTAKETVAPYLKGCKMIDALSSPKFYESGAVDIPIASTTHIDEFLALDIPERWTYYCCSQWNKVGNRFIAYPSFRNRILGVQLYKFNMSGFLQWGYNFWYSMESRRPINPYINQTGDRVVPAGDAFSVYPAPDGDALDSLRIVVFREAIADIGALRACESIIGREATVELIDSLAGFDVTFADYPADPSYILELREKVNSIIRDNI